MNTILIGIPVKNTGKYLPNLFDHINSLDYDQSKLTIVLLEGDSNDDSFQICQQIKDKYTNLPIIVDKLELGFQLEHNSTRYHKDKFPNRIKNLVISRNYIVDNYLQSKDYLWWIDSDFKTIPNNAIHEFIRCDKDIVIPILTHATYGYHDCGSVVFSGSQQIRFQTINSTSPLIKLDRSDTHCFIKADVFKHLRYEFIDQIYYDGCGSSQNCWSDGTSFSFNAIKMGYEVYGAQHIIIEHHDI